MFADVNPDEIAELAAAAVETPYGLGKRVALQHIAHMIGTGSPKAVEEYIDSRLASVTQPDEDGEFARGYHAMLSALRDAFVVSKAPVTYPLPADDPTHFGHEKGGWFYACSACSGLPRH